MSGIFNSFFLLFKNDAGKSKKDIADLEKQIDSLRSKSKARSEEETKQLREAERRHKEIRQQMKESERANEKLADSIASAAAAYVSFGAIKSGIVNAAEFNRTLATQSQNLKVVSNDMRAYAASVKAMGGTEEEFFGFASAKSAQYASLGYGKFDPVNYFRNLRAQLALIRNDNDKRALLSNEGITSPGFQNQVMSEDFDKQIERYRQLTSVSKEAEEAARNYGKAMDENALARRKFWSEAGAHVLPTITSFINGTTEMAVKVASDGQSTKEVLTGMASGAALVSAAVGGMASRLLGLGGAFGSAAAGGGTLLSVIARMAGILGLFATGGLIIGGGIKDAVNGTHEGSLSKAARWWASFKDRNGMNKYSSSEDYELERAGIARYKKMRAAERLPTGDTGGDAMAFWLSQGYNRAQAAAIVANEMHESGGRAGARGDGGRAHGLFQWHPDRRAKILKGTGIDVSNASAMDQRRAAAWEMKNEGIFNDSVFRGISDPNAAAGYFSSNFERPADRYGQAFKRGQTAMNLYGDSSLGAMGGNTTSNSSSVKVDKVEVNTQATDAQGIANDIGNSLENELRYSFGNFDDGVAG